jgi:UDP-N-acetylmuramate--alanine ligase
MMLEAPDEVPDITAMGPVHLIGIGGRGMSGIARILAARGVPVTGSDAKMSAAVTALQALDVRCVIGHDAANIGNAGVVVVSTAIPASNPELVEAQRRGLPVLQRTVALVSLMQGYRSVAIAGTHGKTTTTSMLTVALQHCGADPCFAVGGNLVQSGANAHQGTGDVFVAETDESDGSFVVFSADVSVVTNIDYDHVDQHESRQTYVDSFDRFAARIAPGNVLVICADDAQAAALGDRWRDRGPRVRTYGESSGADVQLVDLRLQGTHAVGRVVVDGHDAGVLRLAVPGRHNALNAVAALAGGMELGFEAAQLLGGLATFRGTARRFEPKGSADHVRVYDDFAHHPTELRAALTAAREVAGSGRVVVVFQSQLYSRTAAFADEFGAALGLADEVVVMDVFGSREDPVPGVTGALIANAVPLPSERVHFVPSWSEVPAVAAAAAGPGDLILTAGSGDVTLVGPEALELLRLRAADPADPPATDRGAEAAPS